MRFYNSRNSNFVMKFRRNRDIDLYFANIFLQFPINIDFFQGAVVSLSASQIHFDRPPPPRTPHRPLVGGSAHVGNRWSKMWSYRLPKFEAVRGVTFGIISLLDFKVCLIFKCIF